MSKHTEGPWGASIGTKGARIHVAQDFNHPLSFGFNWDELDPQLSAEGPANARLIAAAPELLEALKEIHRYATDADYRCEREEHAEATTAGNATYQEAILNRIGMILAKVEGTIP